MARTKSKTLRNKYSNSILTQNLRKRITPENTRELAAACNLSESAVRLWSSGATRPDIDNIPIIARVLNVPIDYLFGYESEKIATKSKDEVKLLNSQLDILFTDSILSYETLEIKEQLYEIFEIITNMFILLCESGMYAADSFLGDVEELLMCIATFCMHAETASEMIYQNKVKVNEFYEYNYQIQREADVYGKRAVNLVNMLISKIKDETIQNLANELKVEIDEEKIDAFAKKVEFFETANKKRREGVTNG